MVDDYYGTLEDLTINKNVNTNKQKDGTKGMVLKFLKSIKTLEHPHESLDTLPEGYDFAQFLGKFCDFRLKKYKIEKVDGLLPSLSNLYGMIIKKFDVEKQLEGPYSQLRTNMMKKFIHKALQTNTPLIDSSPLPNPPDNDFIGEQLWLGGADDAIYRFAYQLNCHCGGRVSEVRSYNCQNN